MRIRLLTLVGLTLYILVGASDSFAQGTAAAPSGTARCSVSGHVTSMLTGLSLKNATVWLRPATTDISTLSAIQMSVLGYGSSIGQAQHSTTSQSDGSFCFENVKPGLYVLVGSKTGYLETSYKAISPTESGTIVNVSSDPLTNLNLALIRHGVVAGRVTDEDDEPVSGASVALLMRMPIGGQMRNVPIRGGPSNDLGEFRLANVAPGEYFVVVDPKSAGPFPELAVRRPLRTLYPSARSVAQATPVVVRVGEERLGINVRVLSGQTHHIRGSVVGLLPSDQGSVQIRPEDEQQVFLAIGGANYKPDGTFDFANIAPGTYIVSYVQAAGEIAKSARRTVTVSDRDVDDVMLSLTNSTTIAGTIRIDGSSNTGPSVDLQKVRINLSAADSIVGPSVNATIGSDGAFVFRNVIPGRYVLRQDPPLGMYARTARYGQVDVRHGEVLVAEGGSEAMEIVYRSGLGAVSGRVESTSDGSSLARVLLVPTEASVRSQGMILGASNTTGAFLLENVPPGRYRAHAFESIDFAALDNPEVGMALRAGGTELQIAEGEQKSATIRLTTSEEQQRLIGIAKGYSR